MPFDADADARARRTSARPYKATPSAGWLARRRSLRGGGGLLATASKRSGSQALRLWVPRGLGGARRHRHRDGVDDARFVAVQAAASTLRRMPAGARPHPTVRGCDPSIRLSRASDATIARADDDVLAGVRYRARHRRCRARPATGRGPSLRAWGFRTLRPSEYGTCPHAACTTRSTGRPSPSARRWRATSSSGAGGSRCAFVNDFSSPVPGRATAHPRLLRECATTHALIRVAPRRPSRATEAVAVF
ncbi:hypothetical protein M885DRAFT_162725 [Pelagophyceae sp. CCMP2097]|nr:hypothetical protein M885DRAFT_162725 [Pelagophyceae sp. CCMP2097]|mmetsp:Transcript_13686/g.48592  ORF Transcript_13686/g.48592 Transcript_13686/m.48592 type:complete len:248 (+) Transcript_13686:66-809(+)